MNEVYNYLGEKEYVVEYTKTKGPVFLFLFGVFFLVPGSIGAILMNLDLLIHRKSIVNSDVGLVCFGSIGGGVIISIIISEIIRYFKNKIIIAESFIIIKHASLGKTFKISKKSIIAK